VVEITVSDKIVNGVDTPPKVTEVASKNPNPEIVTPVPPAVGPTEVLRESTAGTSEVYRSARVVALVPAASETVMSEVPCAARGTTAVIEVSEIVENVAGTVPKSTAVALRNPDPVIVTVTPALPTFGLTALTDGAPTVNRSCTVAGEVDRIEEAATWIVVD
jgi:hypothetical protein